MPCAISGVRGNGVAYPPRGGVAGGRRVVDPRNYLGLGDFDFVPTRLIGTAAFKTASDDWLTDFKQNGFATIPTGRLPVRTPAEADLVVSKIVSYDQVRDGSWKRQAVVVADQNIDTDFTTEANAAAAFVLPSSLQVTKILANGQNTSTIKQQLLDAVEWRSAGGELHRPWIGRAVVVL